MPQPTTAELQQLTLVAEGDGFQRIVFPLGVGLQFIQMASLYGNVSGECRVDDGSVYARFPLLGTNSMGVLAAIARVERELQALSTHDSGRYGDHRVLYGYTTDPGYNLHFTTRPQPNTASYSFATLRDLKIQFRNWGAVPVVADCQRCGATGRAGLHNLIHQETLCIECLDFARNHSLFGRCAACNVPWVLELWGSQLRCERCAPNCETCGTELEGDGDGDGWSIHPQDSNRFYCFGCYEENFRDCNRCGRIYPNIDLIHVESDEDYDPAVYCHRCHEQLERERNTIPPGTKGICTVEPDLSELSLPTLGFGVEIEAHFSTDGDGGIRLSGYHRREEASPPLFSKWRAETDASIYNGGEVISPVLHGPAGIAEVIATMRTLQELEASVTGACGQHIHVDSEVATLPLQALTGFAEDLMIALTGSFRRWSNNYTPRVKGGTSDILHRLTSGESNTPPERWRQDAFLVADRPIAYRTDYGTIEFRYPPGTLNGTQFVINRGLIELVTSMAGNLTKQEVGELVKEIASYYQQHRTTAHGYPSAGRLATGGPWVHDSIMSAAKFLREKGEWTPGGKWKGIGYIPDATGAQKVQVTDPKRGISQEASLPSERDLFKRMERQLTNFYVSAHRVGGWWSESEGRDKAQEVLAVLG